MSTVVSPTFMSGVGVYAGGASSLMDMEGAGRSVSSCPS